jgi:hypothetical protein
MTDLGGFPFDSAFAYFTTLNPGYRSYGFFAKALLRRNALGRSPFLEQRLATARIALVGEFQCGDAIGAEMAVVAAQFAPRRDDADAIEKRQRKRPHRAPGLRAVLVDIGDGELAFDG